jgi:hypothetical protein
LGGLARIPKGSYLWLEWLLGPVETKTGIAAGKEICLRVFASAVCGGLGSLLIIAAFAKARWRGAVSGAVTALLPRRISVPGVVHPAVWALIGYEATLGMALLVAAGRAHVASLVLGACTFFGFALVAQAADRRRVDCGCLGFLTADRVRAVRYVYPPQLNALLGAVALAAAVGGGAGGVEWTAALGGALLCSGALVLRLCALGHRQPEPPPAVVRTASRADQRVGSHQAIVRPGAGARANRRAR